MEKPQPSVVPEVFERPAGVLQYTPIDVVDLARRRGAPHQGGNCLGDQAEMVFARAEGLFGVLAIFYVGKQAIPAQNIAIVAPQRVRPRVKPAIYAIGAPETDFRLERIS